MSDLLNAFLGFFKIVSVIMFIAHWTGCIFYAIGSSEMAVHENCWIKSAGLEDKTIKERYIISLYWAFTTMTTVGYGDVSPITMYEKFFAMISMLVACGVFAYVVGSIENLARKSNNLESDFKEKILHVN